MKKKILLSVVASALLTTNAFANGGKLDLAAGAGKSTIEYTEKYGNTNSLNLGNIVYEAGLQGSGSVSDALIRIDLTDTNLTNTANAGLDVANLSNTPAVIKNEDNETVATYDKKITVAGKTYFLFDGDATQSIVDGVKYRITNDDNDSINISYSLVNGGNINLDVWSTSGTEEKRDESTARFTTTTAPQFETSCITKFDGLINIESLQDSFVTTNHDNDSNGSLEATDGLIQWDTLVFTVNNTRGDGNYLDGNSSAITLQTRNADGTINTANEFNNTNIWNAKVVAIEADGKRVDYDLTIDNSLTTLEALRHKEKIINYTIDGNLTFVLDNRTISAGLTTYYIGLGHTAGSAGIKPVQFVNGHFLLEAGLADDNNTLYPAINVPRNAAQDGGKWINHAFISQIPAGESGGAKNMTTRYFITNRSCSVVTPQIDVVYDGEVYSATGVEELPVNRQKVYKLKEIMMSIPELAAVWNENKSTQVSVEITIPGIAEQFYIYAQVKNGAESNYKDLPVYNTSNRD